MLLADDGRPDDARQDGQMSRLRRVPIRLRLALAFAAVMAVVLAATGAFVYLRLQSDLDRGVDQTLASKATDVATLTESSSRPLRHPVEGPLAEGGETFAQILTPTGRVVDAPPSLRSRSLLTRDELRRATSEIVELDRVDGRGLEDPSRLLATPVQARGRQLVAVVGAALDDRDETLDSLAAVLLIGGPAALLLASLAGYGVAAAALRPVESMRRKAAGVSVTTPGDRLPVSPARDEIARLGETLNEMLDRQEAAFARERAFVGDASHELRTPLAILRTELELALRGDRSAAELEAAVRSAAEETDRLNQLAEDLLVIARADQGQLPVQLARVPARTVLERVAQRFGRRAADAGRAIRVESSAAAVADADPLRVEQAVGNLVENALRHGAGDVVLAVEPVDGAVEIHVRDDGPGFPPPFLDSAFERFTRADAARARGGTGLGLAIVDAIATAHGGSRGARNRPAGGADVWISLPAQPSDPPLSSRPTTAGRGVELR
jgi:two-component system, OmpR family, sensor kinase